MRILIYLAPFARTLAELTVVGSLQNPEQPAVLSTHLNLNCPRVGRPLYAQHIGPGTHVLLQIPVGRHSAFETNNERSRANILGLGSG